MHSTHPRATRHRRSPGQLQVLEGRYYSNQCQMATQRTERLLIWNRRRVHFTINICNRSPLRECNKNTKHQNKKRILADSRGRSIKAIWTTACIWTGMLARLTPEWAAKQFRQQNTFKIIQAKWWNRRDRRKREIWLIMRMWLRERVWIERATMGRRLMNEQRDSLTQETKSKINNKYKTMVLLKIQKLMMILIITLC